MSRKSKKAKLIKNDVKNYQSYVLNFIKPTSKVKIQSKFFEIQDDLFFINILQLHFSSLFKTKYCSNYLILQK